MFVFPFKTPSECHTCIITETNTVVIHTVILFSYARIGNREILRFSVAFFPFCSVDLDGMG